MALTPEQEAQYALSYGSREDLRSDEARAAYDRLAAAESPVLTVAGPAAAPARKRVPRVIVVRFCTALLVLAAGLIIEGVTGGHAALCNSALGQLGQAFSQQAAEGCSAWTGVHTFGEFVLWLGIIGSVGLGAMLAVAAQQAKD